MLYSEPPPAGKLTPTEDESQPLFSKQELEDAFVAAAARDGLTTEQQKEAGLRTFREVDRGQGPPRRLPPRAASSGPTRTSSSWWGPTASTP